MSINDMNKWVQDNLETLILAIIVILLIYTIIMLVMIVRHIRLTKRYNKLMRGVGKNTVEELIGAYQDKVESSQKDAKLALDNVKLLNSQINHCIQKVGMVRYKAFDDVGSDLSYSIAMLDNHNDGVILTNIFGRNMSTSYAKPVVKGASKYNLSDEELYAMNKALGLEKK